MVIIAIAVSALVFVAVVSAPVNPVDFSQQEKVAVADQTRLNLDFNSDIGDIYIYTNLTGDNMVLMDVSATGRTSLFDSNQPVTFTVDKTTANNTQMVNADVSSTAFPFGGNLNVVCKIYVNPDADLMLTVHSTVGEVYMDADSNVTLSMLSLSTTTGNTRLNLKEGVTLNGSLSVSVTTGNVWFSMKEANINGNYTLTLHSSTGDVNIDINQTQKFNADLHVIGSVSTGNINLDELVVDGEVAAKIASNTGLGQIKVNMDNFDGSQSLIQSNNYPSNCNINFNLSTSVGNINIDATYQTDIGPTLRV
jgi:hypothetical protein